MNLGAWSWSPVCWVGFLVPGLPPAVCAMSRTGQIRESRCTCLSGPEPAVENWYAGKQINAQSKADQALGQRSSCNREGGKEQQTQELLLRWMHCLVNYGAFTRTIGYPKLRQNHRAKWTRRVTVFETTVRAGSNISSAFRRRDHFKPFSPIFFFFFLNIYINFNILFVPTDLLTIKLAQTLR